MRLFGFGRKKEKEEAVSIGKTLRIEPLTEFLSFEVANLQGVGARNRQEDSFVFVNVFDVTKIKQEGLMFLVADGMGGMKDGKIASEAVVTGMREVFRRIDRDADIAMQIHNGVFEVGAQVVQLLGGYGGSTLVACVVYQEQLYFASVGDSFLYLMRDGHLYRLNKEHTLLNQRLLENIRSGNMDRAKLEKDDEDEALTQFIGMDGMDEVDFFRKPFPLRHGDILLACSDGVGSVLSQQTILSCMDSGKPGEICASIEKQIIMQGRRNQDNYTALVVKCAY